MLLEVPKTIGWIKNDYNPNFRYSNSLCHLSLDLYVQVNAQWSLLLVQGEWVYEKKPNTRTLCGYPSFPFPLSQRLQRLDNWSEILSLNHGGVRRDKNVNGFGHL